MNPKPHPTTTMNDTEPTKSDQELWIGVFLIIVSILLLMRGIKHGNTTMTAGIAMVTRYFTIEERIMEMASSVKIANEWIPWKNLASLLGRSVKC
jgi:uncharacterized membrane protein YfbV (UPF0208 family)